MGDLLSSKEAWCLSDISPESKQWIYCLSSSKEEWCYLTNHQSEQWIYYLSTSKKGMRLPDILPESDQWNFWTGCLALTLLMPHTLTHFHCKVFCLPCSLFWQKQGQILFHTCAGWNNPVFYTLPFSKCVWMGEGTQSSVHYHSLSVCGWGKIPSLLYTTILQVCVDGGRYPVFYTLPFSECVWMREDTQSSVHYHSPSVCGWGKVPNLLYTTILWECVDGGRVPKFL